MEINASDSIVIPVPLFHAFGLIIGELCHSNAQEAIRADYESGVCTAYLYGAAVVLPSEYWDAGATLNAVEKQKCTGLYGVTTMFVDELSHPRFATTDRSSLKCVLFHCE